MARLAPAHKGGRLSPPDPWDPLIRLTHWTVAFAIVGNGLINKAGGTAHIWIGWTVMALLAIRLVWGVLGPTEARFSAFPPDPRAALSHLADLMRGKPKEHASHNPAGALMVYALWGLLTVVSITGLVMTGGASPIRLAEEKAAVAAGDWSVLANASRNGEYESDLGEFAEEMHELAANLLLILALLHVAGVVVESRALRRNLVRPMLFGSGKPK